MSTVARDEYRTSHVASQIGLRRDQDGDLFGDSHSEAVFSADDAYRYLLIRRWCPGGTTCTFVMLNPSTATASADDPTISRCISFARREGCNALAVVNLFALRSTDPAGLYRHADPVGDHNDRLITDSCLPGRLVIAAWGAHGTLSGRGDKVARTLAGRDVDLQCFGITKHARQPRHPLYVPANEPLVPYVGTAAQR